jgi:site-specific DNA recombinase
VDRAVIYTRVSTVGQEDGYSLQSQEKDCRRYCDTKAYAVVATESDTYTGMDSYDEREGMQAAIKRIRRGEANVLVCWRIDRVSRSDLDNRLLLRDVSEAGARLEAATEGGEIPNTRMGIFMLNVRSFVAGSEWDHIREITQRGIQARIDEGSILVGNVPLYGYRFTGEKKGQYEIDPESGPVVQDIFAKADAGWSTRHIAIHLTEQGTPTPSRLLSGRGELPGKLGLHVAQAWSRQQVRGILNNESYTGRHVVNRNKYVKLAEWMEDGKKKTKKRREDRPETDAKCVAMTIPALVSVEVWARVRQRGARRDHEAPSWMKDPPLLNKGFAICGMCGSLMQTKHNSHGTRVYVCRHRSTQEMVAGKQCPGRNFAVPATEVDQGIWQRVKALMSDPERFDRMVQSQSAEDAERHADALRRAQNIDRELADLQALQKSVYELWINCKDPMTAGLHESKLQEINASIPELQERTKEVHTTVSLTQGVKESHRALLEKLTQTTIPDYKADPAAQERLQESLAQIGVDSAKHLELVESLPLVVEKMTLDQLTREQKREFLQFYRVQVPMYPVNSEWARTHEHRWDFHYYDPADGALRKESSRGFSQSPNEAAHPQTRPPVDTCTPPFLPWTTK